MAFGWFLDVADAENYFSLERLETEAWDELTNAQKQRVLVNAYNRIYHSKEFIVPTYADATSDDLVVLRKANGEMAYYLAVHQDDEDRRKGLEAQAVVEAGIVKEKYDKDKLYDTAIPQFVRDILCAYLAGEVETAFGVVDLCRDENFSVNEDVCDLD
jgi:hypothetical protein